MSWDVFVVHLVIRELIVQNISYPSDDIDGLLSHWIINYNMVSVHKEQ